METSFKTIRWLLNILYFWAAGFFTPYVMVMAVKRMRKCIALALVFTLLFDNGMYYYFFHAIRQEIRRDQMEKVEEGTEVEASAVIHVTPQNAGELQWTRSGKEFRYKGSMYDVIRKAVNGINTYYYCMFDKKESSLVSKMDKTTRAHKDATRKVNHPVFIKFIGETLLLEKPEFTIAKSETMRAMKLLTRCPEMNTPPPRLFS
jgi:hypothetical protein